MENMKALLQQASEDYYNGKPTMSDEQFDKLAVYAKYDEVGYSSRDNRVPHAFQMYSLQKIFSNELDKDPLADYKGATIVSPKLDGAAVSLLYVSGQLHKALTRGDGKRGLDITDHMKTLVPNSLGKFTGTLLQITGEVVAPKTIKNARNYAAGALNLKDTSEFQSRDLRFIAYGVQESWNEAWTMDMSYLNSFGFDTVLSNDWTAYPDDGIVFRVDNYKDFYSLGYTSKHPRGAYALKQRNEGVITKLVDVIWNVGKSGVVAPVAILEPVDIDGATVSRATLHNMRYIKDLNLEIGCLVEVIRSGEIIPRIISRAN
jgi:NAD-dependent DNA ligase|tara:strand:- start:394 stop:1344 length:951 start_codon:yes stop_codon:yes gene_type:complete